MLLLEGAQDVLQQQGDSGGQGLESFRHLGKERQNLSVGEEGEVALVIERGWVWAAGETTGNEMEREMSRREVGLGAR